MGQDFPFADEFVKLTYARVEISSNRQLSSRGWQFINYDGSACLNMRVVELNVKKLFSVKLRNIFRILLPACIGFLLYKLRKFDFTHYVDRVVYRVVNFQLR